MRTFIAIELPRETKDFLSHIQEQLKASQADVKWVQPKNIHLTLKFLGEINDKEVADIAKILEDTARNKNSFYMRISSVGAFPNINRPRVIWVGIDKGNQETIEIAQEIEERIAKIGIPKEKKGYSCHITIGRTRSDLNREKLIQGLKASENNFTQAKYREFLVSKIILFKSTLTPKGPIYASLKEANLMAS